MVSCFVSLYLAAAMGQAPAEAAWLKAVPADVAVVARVKALESARDDIGKMLQAMSGNAAAMAQPQMEQGLAMFTGLYGQEAAKNPLLVALRLPKDGPVPAWAVLTQSNDYNAVLKGVSRKDDLKPKSLGGYDSFVGADEQTYYSVKGAGFVAFGQDEALIKSIAKPAAALSEKISAELSSQLLGGDLGVYVNVAALQAQYGEQIEQGKQMALGTLDQAGAQLAGNMKESMKQMYGALFDAVKTGDALAFNVDFAAEGLGVAGLATVKEGSDAAKKLAGARSGSAELLGKLPAGGTSFVYANIDPASLGGLQKFGLSMMTGQAKLSPEMEKALAMQRQAGAFEMYTSNSGGAGGMSNVSLSTPTDPAKAVEAASLSMQAMKSGEGFVKDVKLTPKAQSYKGISFTEAKMTFDVDKMVAPGAPGGVDAVKKMLGGDTVTTWFGTDGKNVLSVSGKTFDEAKAQVDAILTGKGSVGQTAGFEAIRGRFPKQVTALFLISAQGMVKQMATQMGVMTGKGDVPVPAGMPKEPAFFGGSLTTSPQGFQFQWILPSKVGPVIEQGLIPMMQGLQGPIQ